MDSSIKNALLSLSEIINQDCPLESKSFYIDILNNINSFINARFCSIAFLSDDSLTLKASVGHSFFEFDKNDLKNIIKTKERTFTYNISNANCLISKLLIRNSFFGFVYFSKENTLRDKSPDNFSDDEILAVDSLVSVYSYLIKDYELNSVFKMQLKLMQEAVIEKENAYKIIEKQHKKLIESDKVKTNFLSNVSHELRTPLNAIIGFSDALRSKLFGQLNDKQLEYIKDIHKSGLHLMGVINSILDISKIESGSLELNLKNVDTNLLLDEAINIIKPLSDAKNIKIRVESNCAVNINLDAQKFQQILYNLLGNAIKYSHDNSEILVKTEVHKQKFTLEVRDFGIGIDKKHHNKIFKKFTQLDNIYTKTQGSTGLGLAITKELVKLHKGKIYVVSEAGKGSSFIVEMNTPSK